MVILDAGSTGDPMNFIRKSQNVMSEEDFEIEGLQDLGVITYVE